MRILLEDGGIMRAENGVPIAPGVDPTPPPESEPIPAQPPGDVTRQSWVNFSRVTNFSSSVVFKDIWLQTSPWYNSLLSGGFNNGGAPDVDANGWVTQIQPGRKVQAGFFVDRAVYDPGQYVILYDGEGTIVPDLGTATLVSSVPGRVVINVNPGNKIYLAITATNPANYMRNIRFMKASDEASYQSQPFNEDWLNKIAPFAGYRFMNWGRINDSEVVNWGDRTTLNTWTQGTRNGVAHEWAIRLCNQTGKPGWFCVPHQATDDYIWNMATLFKNQMNPDLKIYLEYSNELWNPIFKQYRWVANRANALGIEGSSEFTRAMRYASELMVRTFQIWRNVFGSQASTRLVNVFAGQAANTFVLNTFAGWKGAAEYMDVGAIAPYVDPSFFGRASNGPAAAAMTPDQVVDALKSEIRTVVKQRIAKHVALMRDRFGSKPLVCYEGGTHLYVNHYAPSVRNQAYEVFLAANRSPRMLRIYREYLEIVRQESGGGFFNQYDDMSLPTQFGFWGILEGQKQNPADSPRYQAMLGFLSNSPYTPED